jgi:hypothetical protein
MRAVLGLCESGLARTWASARTGRSLGRTANCRGTWSAIRSVSLICGPSSASFLRRVSPADLLTLRWLVAHAGVAGTSPSCVPS